MSSGAGCGGGSWFMSYDRMSSGAGCGGGSWFMSYDRE